MAERPRMFLINFQRYLENHVQNGILDKLCVLLDLGPII